MSKIIYPKLLEDNSLIAITATSSGIYEYDDILRLNNAIKNLNEIGYKVIETKNVRQANKLVSSSKEQRACEFMELWKNNDVSLIAQLRGGEFLMEMIPYIDKNIILNNSPKWISGYSDSSLLNFYITTNFNIATLTSNNILSFGMDDIHKSVLNSVNCLKQNKFIEESYKLYQINRFEIQNPYNGYNLTEKVIYKHLYNKKNDIIKGRIISGCIDVISILLGTKYDNTSNFVNSFDVGIVWCIENCELSVCELYRKLWQMKQANWFSNTNGVLIGRTHSKEEIGKFTYEDVLHDIFDELNIPVIYDIDFGHIAPRMSIINGSYITFEYKNNKGKLIQEMK